MSLAPFLVLTIPPLIVAGVLLRSHRLSLLAPIGFLAVVEFVDFVDDGSVQYSYDTVLLGNVLFRGYYWFGMAFFMLVGSVVGQWMADYRAGCLGVRILRAVTLGSTQLSWTNGGTGCSPLATEMQPHAGVSLISAKLACDSLRHDAV